MTPGDGNFHTMLLFDPADPEEYKRCKEVAERMICRREEAGDDYARNKWERTQISHKAEQQCREVSGMIKVPVNQSK